MNADRAVGAVNSETRRGLSRASEFFAVILSVSEGPLELTRAFARSLGPSRTGLSARDDISQKSASVRILDLCDLLGRANAHDLAAVLARFRSKIDSPITGLTAFELVL